MKRRFIYGLILILSISILSGCSTNNYEKYEGSFFDTFDTLTKVVGYTESKEEFDLYMETIHGRFTELHKLFDKYKTYDGMNNIKDINDNAGIKPVEVEDEIIDLILFSKEWYEKAGEETNIAMGPVIEIWADYSDAAEADPENAEIPPMGKLEKAAKYTDLEKVIVDEENSTVFLEEENMVLDVGAIAKGYAVELVAKEIEEEGLKSAIISGGGNIRTIGKPLDDVREKWGIGIQNPDKDLIDTGNILETVFVNDYSVVSSGDYQRYFVVDGKRYHHIIDPHSLMPGDHYRAITIITPDSGVADLLSTSAYLLPFEESKELIDSLEDTEAIWVMKDGSVEITEGIKDIALSQGASGGKAE
ncbi:MAG: FAD:protein FMN transferase [Tissierella sp.]|uniref:FAD:protein FMN transferase n=1 Tax=Tissierella sp. TaxID=41274 RepID=UPI003F9AD673